MDNTNPNPPVQQTQPVQQSPLPAQPIPQPIQPVSGRAKEAWVAPSTPEVVLPQEVQEIGVESSPVVPVLSNTAQQAGVSHAKEATTVILSENESLGMKTPPPIITHLKTVHKKVSDSITWLIRLIMKEQEKKEKGILP